MFMEAVRYSNFVQIVTDNHDKNKQCSSRSVSSWNGFLSPLKMYLRPFSLFLDRKKVKYLSINRTMSSNAFSLNVNGIFESLTCTKQKTCDLFWFVIYCLIIFTSQYAVTCFTILFDFFTSDHSFGRLIWLILDQEWMM